MDTLQDIQPTLTRFLKHIQNKKRIHIRLKFISIECNGKIEWNSLFYLYNMVYVRYMDIIAYINPKNLGRIKRNHRQNKNAWIFNLKW